MTEWESVIGLEVHAQLLTRTKIFCGCATHFGAAPNTQVCPTCLGLPGALPALNADAVRLAMRAALALECELRETSRFARKNYFYPDLPKGYQISQFDEPLAEGGALEIEVQDVGEATPRTKRVRIQRVHMEEDAGKSVHGEGSDSRVDLNRAGVPLIEIVGEPDLRSAAEAGAYLRAMRDVLVFAGVNDGNLEEGSFRCDANVSIRPRGSTTLGTRVELKNINSFKFVEKAIAVEVRRQIDLTETGGRVTQETRGWDEARGETVAQRSKETAHDYRYFPDPDLPPLALSPALIAEVRARLPELPRAKRARFVSELSLTPYAAEVLTSHPRVAAFFEEAATLHGDPARVGNFVQAEVLRDVTTRGLTASLPVTAKQLVSLLSLVDDGTISGKQAKELYAAVRGTDRDPREVARELGLAQVTDAAALEQICRSVIDKNPKQFEQLKAGKAALYGFFVGQVMKETQGSANPKIVNDVLRRLLEEG
ncbi:MAG: Asp-tRNA(Asn)/Glu-tRNA(Gln) amidotransferase subunit GatB [Myxococcales bacterium]|nr:Asp-tRNA(Asn)/Glu-tRNA(Gln) amidotransferase subunit GatB [Myxococcales bacterium]